MITRDRITAVAHTFVLEYHRISLYYIVVTLLQFLGLGLRHSSSLRLSRLSLLTNTLPGPSAYEDTALLRYTNLFTIIIIIF